MILYKPWCPIILISADETQICSGTTITLT